MSTTLHLLLGDKHPHDMPAGCITRDHMLALHKALLHWLLTGSPPPLWRNGCLIDTVSELPYTDSWLHQTHSIASATALQGSRPWLPTRLDTPAPPPRAPSPEPSRQRKKAKRKKEATPPRKPQPLPETHPAPTTHDGDKNHDQSHVTTPPAILNHKTASLFPAQTWSQLAQRGSLALSRQTKRFKSNRADNQATLTQYWPHLVPQSLPIRPACKPILPSQPNNLHSYGW